MVTTLVLEGWSARLDPGICLMARRTPVLPCRRATTQGSKAGDGPIAHPQQPAPFYCCQRLAFAAVGVSAVATSLLPAKQMHFRALSRAEFAACCLRRSPSAYVA